MWKRATVSAWSGQTARARLPCCAPGRPGHAQRRVDRPHARADGRLPAAGPATAGREERLWDDVLQPVRLSAPPGRNAAPAGREDGRSGHLRRGAGRVRAVAGRLRSRRRLRLGASCPPGADRPGLPAHRAHDASDPSQRRAAHAWPAGQAAAARTRPAADGRADQPPRPSRHRVAGGHPAAVEGKHGGGFARPLFPRPCRHAAFGSWPGSGWRSIAATTAITPSSGRSAASAELKEWERQQGFIAKEQDYIRRNIAGNTKQAQGRRTRLERLAEMA